MIQKIKFPTRNKWESLLQRPKIDHAQLSGKVQFILDQVKLGKDSALKEFSAAFDHFELSSITVSKEELSEAAKFISKELAEAIDLARKNIEAFHASQLLDSAPIETSAGVTCWRRSVAIERIGLYVPGGSAPLFSSVLMLAVPARVAGVKEIVLCTPPLAKDFSERNFSKHLSIHPAIAYCANMLQIESVYAIGGAQAIAAMAYGTETIKPVSKIFGPGNQYVTLAKQLVSKEGIAIDLPAGPSEVLVIADETANPAFIAADLLSQAEHGIDSQVVLVTTSESVLNLTIEELSKQLQLLDRKEIAQAALANSKAIIVRDIDEAFDISNFYAPEHLIIMLSDLKEIQSKVINAGSVFLGDYSPESAGDYASGTNHTLPTGGYARSYSGVSLDSFLKKITFQMLSKEGLQKIGPAIEHMAMAEGLMAHKEAVSIRLRNI